MPYKVAISTWYDDVPQDEGLFQRIGAEYVKKLCSTEEELYDFASDADAVIASALPMTREGMKRLEKCRIIGTFSIGFDRIDIDAATDYGICITNVPDYCLEEVSDHAMALLLALARRLFPIVKAVRDGKWDSVEKPEIRYNLYPGMERLRGQTVGLVGLGNIARTLVPKAKGFGFKVIAFDPYIPANVARELGVEIVDFDRLLRESDYISCHTPLTPETSKMFGLEEFKKMKPSAYFINAARGALVDEEALHTALTQGYIAGAGLDVMDPEPPKPDNPLLNMDIVLITAHSAHFSETSTREQRRGPEQDVARVLQGQWPRNLVNPKVKEKFVAKWGQMK